jgi:eukaryotic-like serine/threonine-protein kinase
MRFPQGTQLGPYNPESFRLGPQRFGLQNRRLNRTVAIKILPALSHRIPFESSASNERPKLFLSLNHPYIRVLYDVGHQDGIDYLVMECVQGETPGRAPARVGFEVWSTDCTCA